MYKGVSDACFDSYLMKLQNLKMKEDEKVMTYVNRLTEIENELATVGHTLEKADKKRALLRGLREEFGVTARVIRAMDMNFTKAISELVVEEGARETEAPSEDGGSKALTTMQTGKHCCSHCGRKEHTADKFFHNPSSPCYRKKFSRNVGQSQKNHKRQNQSKNRNKGHHNDDAGGGDVANVALMSKSVLRGDVKVNPTMKKKWFVDSASTSHICNDENKFKSLTKQPRRPVEVGEGQLFDFHGIGIVRGTAVVDGKKQPVTMRAVLYVPTMICNLISVSKARRSGFKATFDGDDDDNGFCEIKHKKTNSVYMLGIERPDGLYEAVFQSHHINPKTFLSATTKQKVWYQRLAHLSNGVIAKTIPIVKGIDLKNVKQTSPSKCEDCQVAKSCRKPRFLATEESRKSTGPLDLVHADIVGPMKHSSFSGKKYFIPLYDDNSVVSLVRFLSSRSEAGQAIKEVVTDLETMRKGKVNHLNITSYDTERVKRLRTDNAKELLSKKFKKWLQEKGIQHELTSAYSPESNGKAERLNRSLLDMSRTMLLSAKHLPNHNKMWAEAVNNACYIRNRVFSTASSHQGKTPYEVLLNKKPDLSHIRLFGSKAYVHIPKQKRKGKFAERARIGYLVGYDRGNSYRVYLPDEGKTVTRDVNVDENATQNVESNKSDQIDDDDGCIQFDDPFKPFLPDDTQVEGNQEEEAQDDVAQVDDEQDDIQANDVPVNNIRDDVQVDQNQDNVPVDDVADGVQQDGDYVPDKLDAVTHFPDLRRSSRASKPPERLGYDTAMLLQQARMQNDDATTPLTFKEAGSGPDAKKWKEAMDQEMKQFEKMKTMKLVELPEGARTIKNKWVYFTKRDAPQRLTRSRARLVAKGFSQQKGVDYDEVFSPVAKYSTVRMMLAFAAQEELEMLILDVKAAFLNGKLDETIFMVQPEGFVIRGKESMVYQRLRAIYGLKQASRASLKSLNAFLKALGFSQSNLDSSLYFLVIDGETVYLLVYVDDILMIARVMKILKRVAKMIEAKFDVRIEKSVSKFLGMVIEQDSVTKKIKLHSFTLVDQMLHRFSMTEFKPANTPLPEGITLSVNMKPVDEGEKALMKKTPYRQLVGCILHLANTTRPYIAFAAGYLSRFMQEPGVAHWKAAKHVLRYLKGTQKLGIVYGKKKNVPTLELHGCSDSDFAGNVGNRKSTSVHCLMLGGGAISWRSKKQSVIAQSTVEAEYMALSFAVREAIGLRKAEIKRGCAITKLNVASDTQGALCLARDEVENERSKQIDVKYHFIRDQIARGTVMLRYVPSDAMVGDVMPKPLGRVKHQLFVKMMGMEL